MAIVMAATISTWACSTESPTDSPTGPAAADAPPAITAAPTARYRVTFESTWSQATHPNDWPPDAHYSRLVGGTHRDTIRFWSPGAPATEGIRRMAEEGRTSPLDEEIRGAISAGTGQHLLEGSALNFTPGTLELEFEIGRDYPLVTLVTMVAPSPDWFVGVTALPLLEGDWVAERRVTLQPWDAGTDSGVTFRSPNRPSDPRQPIHVIEDGPFRVGSSVPPVGTFTFRRLS
jgi:hypothetical protein